MAPSPTLIRRRLAAFALLAAIAITAIPQVDAGAAAPRHRAPTWARTGDRGLSSPAIPIARARTAERAIVWSDLDTDDRWARDAIDHVGATNDWMRDFAPDPDGRFPFQPETIETRKYFARAVVRAFAPADEVDPTITFADLDPSDPLYPYANIAVQRRWMRRTAAGGFAPDVPVTTTMVHRVLTLALGMGPAIKALNHLHTEDGATFELPANFGSLLLGMRLGLRYNNRSDESQDVGPRTPLSRAQVAYSLYRATTQPSWSVPALLDEYEGIVLPSLSESARAIVQWGVRYVGYPYVYAGEWGMPTSAQPVPGFDCSGLTWWLMRANDGGAWAVAPPRPYAGWTLAERSSADMAATGKRLTFEQLLPGDLMFYDGDGDGRVDHVDTFIGAGWALDSSSTPGGVTIMWVGDGWYRDHFVHGRRILRGV
ncbi:MAG TPA: NlpC/P60 family protein [Actinomycetota bacterium]|jgi:cell wall-associated NlpC family hydrolase